MRLLFIDPDFCTECGLCVSVCPESAIRKAHNPFSPYVWGMIAAYVECVLKGVKPVAHIVVKPSQASFLTRYLWKRGLRVYYQPAGRSLNAFIYKRPELLQAIKQINFRSRNPEDHARYGRLFGYSEESIREYLQKAWKKFGNNRPSG